MVSWLTMHAILTRVTERRMATLITTSFIGKGRKDDVDDGADGGNKARPVPQKQQTDSKKGGNDDAKMRKNCM